METEVLLLMTSKSVVRALDFTASVLCLGKMKPLAVKLEAKTRETSAKSVNFRMDVCSALSKRRNARHKKEKKEKKEK